jgi:hypothetical protein
MSVEPVLDFAGLRAANQSGISSSSEFDDYILALDEGLEPLPGFFFDHRWPTSTTLEALQTELKKCHRRLTQALTLNPSGSASPLTRFLDHGKGDDLRQDLHQLVATLAVYIRDFHDFDDPSGDASPTWRHEANRALQEDHVQFLNQLELFRDGIRQIAGSG